MKRLRCGYSQPRRPACNDVMAPTYTAVIQQRDPWWIGWIEELPGVNSQGTREELLENLHSALSEALDLNRSAALGRAAVSRD